ncbi:hypothetical protein [Ferrimonas aestuarii]|uniref:Uncharacterized protein n=1 Tax=Ferrimonas aestuarii TaxID=2569539 RepID=A0A4U1BUI0_9GAMM|nr:hypothetical protein [Ferrimonas aestuarii]TKB56303.1 hypothetical protein FCL42_08825 [Ferrimonas aestuarii]
MSFDSELVSVVGYNRRVVESCLAILRKNKCIEFVSIDTTAAGLSIIRSHFHKMVALDDKRKLRLLRELVLEAKDSLVPIDKFKWIECSDRAIYWVWMTVAHSSYKPSPFMPCAELNVAEYELDLVSYKNHGLKMIISSSKDRFKELVRFFDRVNQPLGWKLDLIDELSREWAKIYSDKKPFSWLKEDDEEQCRWAFDYIKSYGGKQGLHQKPVLPPTQPVELKEMYLSIYAAFDAWNCIPDLKKMFAQSFNRAWQQKKLRDNRKGKKACSFVIREDAKSKLDEMAKAQGIHINQLVEKLIDDSYVQQIGSLK